VADVISGSPAEKGGIERGDIIIAYDGKEVKSSHDLPTLVAATPVDGEVTIQVLRDGKMRRFPVTIGQLLSEQTKLANTSQPARGKWGLQLHDLSNPIKRQFRLQADRGVVVVGVEPGSPAQEAGVQQGDIILEVNRHPVNSVNEVWENISKSEKKENLLMLVQRHKGKLYVALEQQG